MKYAEKVTKEWLKTLVNTGFSGKYIKNAECDWQRKVVLDFQVFKPWDDRYARGDTDRSLISASSSSVSELLRVYRHP